ncbi:hypothetical protein VTO42DRAFT_1645 [Malbranchea cinnamomea]
MKSALRFQPTLVSSLVYSAQQPALLRLAQSSSSSKCMCRQFSQTSGRSARIAMAQQVVKPKVPATMSLKNRMKDALNSAARDLLPDDIGLLPGTFVRPLNKNMPSIFKEPRKRLRMEWTWLKNRFQDFVSVVAYSKFLMKPKLPFRFRERKRKALELHKQMYTAFAEGDTATLQKICCAGLYQDFAARISRRARSTPKLAWTLHKYIKFPYAPNFSGARVITDRATLLPVGDKENFGIRQTVVRIRSLQSLATPTQTSANNEASQAKAGEVKQQDCTEYVVIQRMVVNGEEGEWKVWGLTNETTLDVVETDPMFAPGLSLTERVEMLKLQQEMSKSGNGGSPFNLK